MDCCLASHELIKVLCCCLVAKSCPTLWRPHGLWPPRLLWPMGFPREEYWSRLPFPFPGDLPNPGIKHVSPTWQEDSFFKFTFSTLSIVFNPSFYFLFIGFESSKWASELNKESPFTEYAVCSDSHHMQHLCRL